MWSTIENTIGTIGSESGTLILDLEYSEGARISLEKETSIAPFAITMGIYGLLVHTIFCGDAKPAIQKIFLLKSLAEKAMNASELDGGKGLNYAIEEIIQLEG